jgi:hypothetical protein
MNKRTLYRLVVGLAACVWLAGCGANVCELQSPRWFNDLGVDSKGDRWYGRACGDTPEAATAVAVQRAVKAGLDRLAVQTSSELTVLATQTNDGSSEKIQSRLRVQGLCTDVRGLKVSKRKVEGTGPSAVWARVSIPPLEMERLKGLVKKKAALVLRCEIDGAKTSCPQGVEESLRASANAAGFSFLAGSVSEVSFEAHRKAGAILALEAVFQSRYETEVREDNDVIHFGYGSGALRLYDTYDEKTLQELQVERKKAGAYNTPAAMHRLALTEASKRLVPKAKTLSTSRFGCK